ncbi:MAG TPA: BatA domain-containing protein [Pirellulales bacterium]|nr:BatA domain-containing protein [Pirellulales bacterium]
MTFLQPWLLAALPLVALPIIIHLVNQRRFQTINWGAMMFLLAARRLSRGYSRLRQWLILALRMAAIAGLVVAVSRPLASGWVGLAAGGRPDTTIVLVDRSPSMQQRDRATGRSKLEAGRQQLVQALSTLGSNHWVLIDSATREPRELESPAALADVPTTGPVSASADLPLMLQAAHDYIRDNRTGRTDIWICSDLRENDWTAGSNRWATLRSAFAEFPQGVRFQLLAYPQQAPDNLSVRVTEVRREATANGAELVVSLRIAREGEGGDNVSVPVHFDVEGARSTVAVDLVGQSAELKDHRIAIEGSRERGWGKVSIPADANPADDEFYFVFDQPPPRQTVIVADEPEAARPLELAAGIAPEVGMECSIQRVTAEQLAALDWSSLALVLWQGPLPTGTTADLLAALVNRGGQVAFFPPRSPGNESIYGVRWDHWVNDNPATVETWRSDEDRLARTLNGAALPLGQLDVRRYCTLSGDFTALATLYGGTPLVARVPTEHGGAYFWATTPSPDDSSLATGGVVLYAFIQRSLAAGAATLGKTRQIDAGEATSDDAASWTSLDAAAGALSNETRFQRGVYRTSDELFAVNAVAAESTSPLLGDEAVGGLFAGLDYSRVDDKAGNVASLVQEIWRAFLVVMLVVMVAEAVLCLPKAVAPGGTA